MPHHSVNFLSSYMVVLYSLQFGVMKTLKKYEAEGKLDLIFEA